METIKVKIVKSINQALWYADKINSIHEVVDYTKEMYCVVIDGYDTEYLINKEDCEIITESPVKENQNEETKQTLFLSWKSGLTNEIETNLIDIEISKLKDYCNVLAISSKTQHDITITDFFGSFQYFAIRFDVKNKCLIIK